MIIILFILSCIPHRCQVDVTLQYQMVNDPDGKQGLAGNVASIGIKSLLIYIEGGLC